MKTSCRATSYGNSRRIKSLAFAPKLSKASIRLGTKAVGTSRVTCLGSFCRADEEKLDLTRREIPNRGDSPLSHNCLDRLQTAQFTDHHVLSPGNAGGQIAWALLLIMGNWLVAVEVQPIGDFPLHVEGGNGKIVGNVARKLFLHRPRRLDLVNDRRSGAH